jgi:putative endonuclease
VAAKALNDLLQRLRAAGRRPGEAGETLACRHLESAGLVVVARNFRCRSGEVDVVARDGDTTVFVEVKERSGSTHGEACDAVTPGKRRRIVRAARIYAAARGLSESPLRFDVVSIDWAADGRPRIRHDAAAFDADGR